MKNPLASLGKLLGSEDEEIAREAEDVPQPDARRTGSVAVDDIPLQQSVPEKPARAVTRPDEVDN